MTYTPEIFSIKLRSKHLEVMEVMSGRLNIEVVLKRGSFPFIENDFDLYLEEVVRLRNFLDRWIKGRGPEIMVSRKDEDHPMEKLTSSGG